MSIFLPIRKLLGALLVIAFILVTVPLFVNASDEISIRLYPDNAKIWFLHYGKKVNWFLVEVWPANFLLTKIGPPTFTLNKDILLIVCAGPDFSVKGKDLFQAFTLAMMPVINKGPFLGVFLNMAGINKDGKSIYSFRYSITYRNIGLRGSGSGFFNQKNEDLKIGPMVSYRATKKCSFECWLAINPYNGEKMVEFVANIKL